MESIDARKRGVRGVDWNRTCQNTLEKWPTHVEWLSHDREANVILVLSPCPWTLKQHTSLMQHMARARSISTVSSIHHPSPSPSDFAGVSLRNTLCLSIWCVIFSFVHVSKLSVRVVPPFDVLLFFYIILFHCYNNCYCMFWPDMYKYCRALTGTRRAPSIGALQNW